VDARFPCTVKAVHMTTFIYTSMNSIDTFQCILQTCLRFTWSNIT
jgi:hypothetical protein